MLVIPAASTETSVTSARPIISADAVEAVRCGFRRALSRASMPAAPPNRAAGQPSTHANGRAIRADRSAVPKKISSVPIPMNASTDAVPLLAQMPLASAAKPSTVSVIAHGVRQRREAPRRQRRALAHRRDRRHAGRLDRGPQAREQRDDDPDEQRDDDRPPLHDEAVVRQREADRVEELEEPGREPEAEEDAGDRGEDAHHERLDDDRPEHLPARGAECPQGGELAGPLRDRDRQRVRDHERADEERDEPEREQEGLEEAEEALDVLRVLLRLRLAGADLRSRREDPLDLAGQPLGRHAGLRLRADLVELALSSKSVCAVARSKPASVAPPRLLAPPNLTIPEMRIFSSGPCAWTPIVSPTFRSFFPAVDLSTTSSCAFGQFPWMSFSELRSGLSGSTLKPRFGAPPKMIALWFLPIR